MQINLQKGQSINLSKETGGAQKFRLEASWDLGFTESFDIDISCVVCDTNKKAKEFIYFNNLQSKNKEVILSGDNRTGEGEGADETIYIDFSKMDEDVKSVQLICSIYNAIAKGQNFGLTKNLNIDLIDETTNEITCSFSPELEASTSTSMTLGEFIKVNGQFYFKALGVTYNTQTENLKEFGIGC